MLLVPHRNLAQDKRNFPFKLYPAALDEPLRDGSLMLSVPPRNKEIMQGLIDLMGRPMHRLEILLSNGKFDLFVDDFAMIECSVRNERATTLYRHYELSLYPRSDPEGMPCICGPAILFSDPVWE